MMGGAIGVDSIEGSGSTFWFTAVLNTEPVDRRNLQPDVPGAPVPIGCRARILVAEDNTVNQYVAIAQLQKLGYEATAVGNGAEAVKAVSEGNYQLVLMDCQMPVMDGFEAARRIRAFDSNIPIVALTANAMPSDRDRCLSEGMNDYLAKPMELEPLSAMLSKWCASGDTLAINTKHEGENMATIADAGAGTSTTVPSRNNVFNADALLGRLMGDRQLAGIILSGFLGDVPSQLRNLEARVHEADIDGVRLQAHTLKGAAATVAAEDLQAIGLALERAAKSGDLNLCGDLLPRAAEEFERFGRTMLRDGWITELISHDMKENRC